MASLYAEAFARCCPERTAGLVMIDGSLVMVPWRVLPTRARTMVRATLIEHATFPTLNADLRALRRRRPIPSVPRVVVGAVHGIRPWRRYWAWKQSRYAQMLDASLLLVVGHHFLVLDRPDEVAAAIDAIRPGPGDGGQ